jgi:hypothetical protein
MLWAKHRKKDHGVSFYDKSVPEETTKKYNFGIF